MDNYLLKEEFIKMFLDGKTYTDISKQTGWSRTFITNLIKDDERVKDCEHYKKIKVYKRNDNKQMIIPIPTDFIKKLGILEDIDKPEYVDIYLDEKNERIIIKKHSK